MVIAQEPAQSLTTLHGLLAADVCTPREQQDIALPLPRKEPPPPAPPVGKAPIGKYPVGKYPIGKYPQPVVTKG
jgi:hypothetical protein